MKQALFKRGWVENPDVWSPCFDFKWTCKVKDIDYDNLHEWQCVNHFDKNESFTSKFAMGRNLRTIIYNDCLNIDAFYPRCFDLVINF